MAVLPIRLFGDKILRRKSESVKEVTSRLKTLAEDMLDTMYAAPGIGLAAPQVGESIRLIVVDVRENDEDEKNPFILFNPEIKNEKGLYINEEGCLSFPEIYAQVPRFEEVTINYLNEEGEALVLENISGMLSRCIQHEFDHLEGILFIDKISETDKLMLKSKLKKLKKLKKQSKENV